MDSYASSFLCAILIPASILLANLFLIKNQYIKEFKNENKELHFEIGKLKKELEELKKGYGIATDDEKPPVISKHEFDNDEALQLAIIRQEWEDDYLLNRDWEKALLALDTYTNLAPDDSFGWSYTAYVQHELKHTEEAIARWNTQLIMSKTMNVCTWQGLIWLVMSVVLAI